MPRGPRLDEPGTLHHVMMRGIEKGTIVQDGIDRTEFLKRMGTLAQITQTPLYAFALMNNHVHILLKSGPLGLASYMRRLLSGYAQYYNRRHNRVGHLFQNRYKSIICEEEAYFDKLVAYIHLNPLKAGLVETLEALASYPWTGHAVIMNRINHSWLDRDYVLGFFGSSHRTAKKAYLDYLQEEIGQDRQKELTGGGIVRSHGGWINVLSMRKKGIRALGNERILGSDAFVRQLLKDAEEGQKSELPGEERGRLIECEIEQTCRDAGITESFLRSGSLSMNLPVIRKQLAVKFVIEHGLSLTETARQLGVTASAVSYMLKHR